jgi:hypothetical protein
MKAKGECRVRTKAIACVLAWQVGLSGAIATAGSAGQSGAEAYWVDATLVSVDAARHAVIYRVATGDVRTTAVLPGAPFQKLISFHSGQPVRLKCAGVGEGTVVVEAKKGGGGHNWWKWGVLTFLGLILVGMLWALSDGGNEALL